MPASIKDYFGFTATPFTKAIGRHQLFNYSQVEEMFVILKQTVEDNDMMLATGRAGTGKTTAVRVFLQGLPTNRYRSIYLGFDRTGNTLLARFAQELGIRPTMARSSRMLQLTSCLEDLCQRSGRQLIIVIDEAHLLEKEALEDLRLLTNADMDQRSPVSVIVLGQHWLRSMLRRQTHEALYQRLRLRYALEGLTEDETKAYIKHHLMLVGGQTEIFDDAATSRIFVASEGILREINNIAFDSLMRTMALNRKKVTDKIVGWVIDQREVY